MLGPLCRSAAASAKPGGRSAAVVSFALPSATGAAAIEREHSMLRGAGGATRGEAAFVSKFDQIGKLARRVSLAPFRTKCSSSS